jgi:hypothetical protein
LTRDIPTVPRTHRVGDRRGQRAGRRWSPRSRRRPHRRCVAQPAPRPPPQAPPTTRLPTGAAGVAGRRRARPTLLQPQRQVGREFAAAVEVARSWLAGHASSGIEGVVAKRLDQPYRPGARGWQKLRTRLTAEAVVGGVIGPLDAPRVLLLGRHDIDGHFHLVGRTRPSSPRPGGKRWPRCWLRSPAPVTRGRTHCPRPAGDDPAHPRSSHR